MTQSSQRYVQVPTAHSARPGCHGRGATVPLWHDKLAWFTCQLLPDVSLPFSFVLSVCNQAMCGTVTVLLRQTDSVGPPCVPEFQLRDRLPLPLPPGRDLAVRPATVARELHLASAQFTAEVYSALRVGVTRESREADWPAATQRFQERVTAGRQQLLDPSTAQALARGAESIPTALDVAVRHGCHQAVTVCVRVWGLVCGYLVVGVVCVCACVRGVCLVDARLCHVMDSPLWMRR